ncbi:MAG: FAD-dependent oxidoreductase [Bacteroidia bacterium]
MKKIAIIGTGIAGMGCGHLLKGIFDITFFEQNDYVGGHTNTITITEDGKDIFIDTGFMVFNHVTYPNLTALFAELNVPTKKTTMSFSVQHKPTNLEYCGSSLNGLFAQRKNIFSPRFIKMLLQINRFNEESLKLLDSKDSEHITLKEYAERNGYKKDLLYKYLIPMSAAVWSTPIDSMLDFPAATLIRFFKNHGFLGLKTQHQWYTVCNGSKSYRDIIMASFKNKVFVNNAVVKVKRENDQVKLTFKNGENKFFDKVIIAAHANQALKILENPSENEFRILSNFKYQKNKAILHTDESVMPKNKKIWSAWNYLMDEKNNQIMPSTIYYMNALQQVSDKKNYFVSINDSGNIAENKILKTIDYEHPLFDVAAIKAQKELSILNQSEQIYFCGSYFNYGFHEDAFASAIQVADIIKKEK